MTIAALGPTVTNCVCNFHLVCVHYKNAFFLSCLSCLSYIFHVVFLPFPDLMTTSSIHYLNSEADKRREIMIDLAIGVGLPILGIILGMSCYYLCLFGSFALQCSLLKIVDMRFLKIMDVKHRSPVP